MCISNVKQPMHKPHTKTPAHKHTSLYKDKDKTLHQNIHKGKKTNKIKQAEQHNNKNKTQSAKQTTQQQHKQKQNTKQ